MSRVRLYIDVDGVVLKPVFGDARIPLQRVAEDLAEFLEWATKHFDCHWLTAWAVDGDGTALKSRLIPKLPPTARKVKVARWKRLKTDAFKDGNFLWIDDELYPEERELLKKRGWTSRYVRVDPFEPSLKPVRAALEARAAELFPLAARKRSPK